MTYRYLFFLLLVLLVFEAFPNPPYRVNSTLDLTGYSFSEHQILTLDGDWEFFWNRLVSPGDTGTPDGTFRIPGYWQDYRLGEHSVPVEGCATFRMKLLLPTEHPLLLLTIPEQLTAWKLWINDSLIIENGQVATTARFGRTGTGAATIHLPIAVRQTITLQVSNFTAPRSGVFSSLVLGTEQAVTRYWDMRRGFDLLMIGALLILAFYNFSLFFYQRKETVHLILGTICLTWAFRFFVLGMAGRFILLLFPNLSYTTLLKMEIVPLFTIAPLLLLFAVRLFPGILSRTIVAGWWVLSIGVLAYALASPLSSWGGIITAMEYLNICATIPFYYVMIRAICKKLPGSVITTIGFTIFTIAAVNDVLYDLRFIYTEHLVNLGIVSIGICFSFYLARRYAQSFIANEKLSCELSVKNEDLREQNRILQENRELKNTLQLQTEHTRQLKLAERTLNQILSSVSEPLFTCGSDGTIVYVNTACTGFLDLAPDRVLDTSVLQLCTVETDREKISRVITREKDLDDYVLANIALHSGAGVTRSCTLHISSITIDDQVFFLFLIGNRDTLQAMPLVRMAKRNRDRITELETLLAGIAPSFIVENDKATRLLGEIDRSLQEVHALVSPQETPDENLARLGVDLLTATIGYWERTNPGKGKIELARESGLWQIYVNKDGWERTQTLDKYLQIDSFPRKPRWNRLFTTADFVLAGSITEDDLRKNLEDKLAVLKGAV